MEWAQLLTKISSLPLGGCCGGVSSGKLTSRCARRLVAMNRHINEACEAIHALSHSIARRLSNDPSQSRGLSSECAIDWESRFVFWSASWTRAGALRELLKSHDRLSAGLKTAVELYHPVRVVCLRERILPRPLTGKVEGSYADVDARPATRIFRVTLIFDTTR